MATAEGALKLLSCCAEVPVKSITASRAVRSTLMETQILAPESIS